MRKKYFNIFLNKKYFKSILYYNTKHIKNYCVLPGVSIVNMVRRLQSIHFYI
jgi:hypothetical protein